MQQPISSMDVQAIGSVRPYQPDGVAPMSGLMSLLGAMVVTGLVLGYAAHHIQQYFWLIILFPLGMGFVLGAVGVWCIGKGKIRNRLAGGFMGFLGGVLAMVVMHHFDYDAFKSKLTDPELSAFVQAVREMTPAERQAFVDSNEDKKAARAVVDAAMVESFMDYLHWEAAQGISIGKAASSSKGAPITGIGVWIYWSIELLIVAVVAYFMTRERASEPFSQAADTWRMHVPLGSFEPNLLSQANAALASGDLPAIVALRPAEEAGAVLVSAYATPDRGDDDEVDVKLETYTADGKNKNTVGFYTYPPGSFSALKAAFTPAPPVREDAEIADSSEAPTA